VTRPIVPRMTVMVTLAAAFAHAVACNGILGNDDKTLDERDTFPEASTGDAGRSDGPADSATCDADLTGDRKNCGACGHDCMAGACAAGKCQPFVLATGQTTPSSLVIEQDVAYWTTGDGTVQSCPLGGCNNSSKKITQIDAGNPAPSGLAVRNGTVYVVGYYSQAVHTCPVAGAPVRPRSSAASPARTTSSSTRRRVFPLRLCALSRALPASFVRGRRGEGR